MVRSVTLLPFLIMASLCFFPLVPPRKPRAPNREPSELPVITTESRGCAIFGSVVLRVASLLPSPPLHCPSPHESVKNSYSSHRYGDSLSPTSMGARRAAPTEMV